MRPTRRRTIRAVGAAAIGASLAGCSFGTVDDTDGTPTERDRSTDTAPATDTEPPTPEPATALVYDITVLPDLVVTGLPDTYRVVGDRARQWIVAEIAAEGDGPSPESFAVETPAAAHETTTDVGGNPNHLPGFGVAYGVRDIGWLAVRLPKPIEDDTVAVTWDGGRRELDDHQLRELQRPPATFEASFQVSRVSSVDGAAISTVTVRNTADVPGTFLGGIYESGPVVGTGPRVVLPVEPGGTETGVHLHRHYAWPGADFENQSFTLRWRGGQVTREVDLSRSGIATATPGPNHTGRATSDTRSDSR